MNYSKTDNHTQVEKDSRLDQIIRLLLYLAIVLILLSYITGIDLSVFALFQVFLAGGLLGAKVMFFRPLSRMTYVSISIFIVFISMIVYRWIYMLQSI